MSTSGTSQDFATIAVVATLLFAANYSSAHVDRIFAITADGALAGFPERYGPASVIVGQNSLRDADNDLPSVVIQIGGRQVHLPICLARLFELPPGETIRAHGSWYHDPAVVPPYLVLDLPRETVSPGWFTGYSLMFDMRDAKLLKVEEQILSADHKELQFKAALDALCERKEVEKLQKGP